MSRHHHHARHAERRKPASELPVREYFHGEQRLYDACEHVEVVKIFTGGWYVSSKPSEVLATVLGSCVSACIRDPLAGVGGMNHFLLPGDENTSIDMSDAARYGMYAMEMLINGIMDAGGHKDRFEVKVFGGGNVIPNSARIGSKNALFIREFLRKEGFRITSEDLEGAHPRRLHYYPSTGKVMLRLLKRADDLAVVDEERKYKEDIISHPLGDNVELF